MGFLTNLILRRDKGSPLLNNEVDDNFENLSDGIDLAAADFINSTEPAVTIPGMKWGDTSVNPPLLRRRSADNLSWITIGKLYKEALPIYAKADVPVTDVGPIHIVGEGAAEYIGGQYVTIGGGAKGGGANKVFYPNDTVITEDMTLTADQNWHSVGPLTIEAEVVVEGNWVIS